MSLCRFTRFCLVVFSFCSGSVKATAVDEKIVEKAYQAYLQGPWQQVKIESVNTPFEYGQVCPAVSFVNQLSHDDLEKAGATNITGQDLAQTIYAVLNEGYGVGGIREDRMASPVEQAIMTAKIKNIASFVKKGPTLNRHQEAVGRIVETFQISSYQRPHQLFPQDSLYNALKPLVAKTYWVDIFKVTDHLDSVVSFVGRVKNPYRGRKETGPAINLNIFLYKSFIGSKFDDPLLPKKCMKRVVDFMDTLDKPAESVVAAQEIKGFRKIQYDRGYEANFEDLSERITPEQFEAFAQKGRKELEQYTSLRFHMDTIKSRKEINELIALMPNLTSVTIKHLDFGLMAAPNIDLKDFEKITRITFVDSSLNPLYAKKLSLPKQTAELTLIGRSATLPVLDILVDVLPSLSVIRLILRENDRFFEELGSDAYVEWLDKVEKRRPDFKLMIE